MKITCIDFETANHQKESACSLGIACIAGNSIVERKEWLIKPAKGFGFFIPEFTDIHGLDWFDVKSAASFDNIYSELIPYLDEAVLVAHNAHFDMMVLAGLLNLYKIPFPDSKYFCTLQAARRVWPGMEGYRLNQLCRMLGHEFTHHKAGSDADAAGHLLLAMMKEKQAASISELADILDLPFGYL